MKYIRKKKPSREKVTILVDDREKQGWKWLKEEYAIESKRLKVGDYSIKGFEDRIAIEKKSGLMELFNNLARADRSRFDRFLARISKYEYKVIVVCEELSERNINYNLAILRKKSPTKMTAETIYFWVAKITMYYGIPIIFTGKRSIRGVVTNLIETVKREVR